MCTSWPKDRADCAVDARIIHPERRCCTHLLLAGRKFGTLSRLAAETAKVRPNAARGNPRQQPCRATGKGRQRKCRLDRSEEHTSELQSLMRISYAVFCLKKKKKIRKSTHVTNTKEYRKLSLKKHINTIITNLQLKS